MDERGTSSYTCIFQSDELAVNISPMTTAFCPNIRMCAHHTCYCSFMHHVVDELQHNSHPWTLACMFPKSQTLSYHFNSVISLEKSGNASVPSIHLPPVILEACGSIVKVLSRAFSHPAFSNTGMFEEQNVCSAVGYSMFFFCLLFPSCTLSQTIPQVMMCPRPWGILSILLTAKHGTDCPDTSPPYNDCVLSLN